MRKWLSKLLGKPKATATDSSGDSLVPDAEYQFKFGTKPMLPDGLRELRIIQLRSGLLILENFDIDLTVDQHWMDDSPEKIAAASRCLRWAKQYHDLDDPPQPPVRLHCGNVLISSSHYTAQQKPEDDISAWLQHFGWDVNRPFFAQQSMTEKPLEDGFVSCVRICCGETSTEDSLSLTWSDRSCDSNVVGCLAGFVEEELNRIGQFYSCEGFLEHWYEQIPREALTHPVFSFLDFPVFDMGTIKLTFSGSVLSANELRFWSRPTYYHK
ncbi:hypothetical protein SV7mr_19460 [Stieleria bergensis]|uniref:Uncharacterized protein n=1 Tax=Stieleria bergensis TaxID=2528025 RepID=A0A517STI7_9BACT|nr:hypothetical protein SV7mr_19460 [Planctomycetes bacterium SV_7m_r]